MKTTEGAVMPRSRHALIGERLAEIDRLRAEIEAELAELPGLIEETRVQALRASPSQATDGVGSDVRRLLEKQAKLERALAALVADRAAAVRVEQEEQEQVRAARIAEAIASAKALRAREAAAYSVFGEKLADLLRIYEQEITAPVYALEALRDDLRREGIVEVDSMEGLSPCVRPVPADFWSALHMAWAAGGDPGRMGRRSTGEGGLRSDLEQRLPGLIPDMTGRERHAFRGVEVHTREFAR